MSTADVIAELKMECARYRRALRRLRDGGLPIAYVTEKPASAEDVQNDVVAYADHVLGGGSTEVRDGWKEREDRRRTRC